MKHVFLSIFALCISYCALSQNDSSSIKYASRVSGLRAGTLFVGASGNFSTSKDSYNSNYESSYSTINLSPKIGVFVAKQFLIGTDFKFQRSKSISQNAFVSNYQITPSATSEYRNTTQLFSIFSRYYIGPWKLKPFIEGSLGIGKNINSSSTENYSNGITTERETKRDINEWELTGGLSYFITKNISLEGALSFGETKIEDRDKSRFFRADFGFSLFF